MLEEDKISTNKRVSLAKRRAILGQHLELGIDVSQLARTYGIHPVTILNWKRKHMADENQKKETPQIPAELFEQLETMRKENAHLKKALAEVSVEKSILSDALDLFKKKDLEDQCKSQKSSK
jgi:transposase-like protein